MKPVTQREPCGHVAICACVKELRWKFAQN